MVAARLTFARPFFARRGMELVTPEVADEVFRSRNVT